MVDLDQLLHGSTTWEQVVEYWKGGEFHEEQYLVEAIEKHLQTEEQRQAIFDMRLSIEKMLNGRYHSNGDKVSAIYEAWNEKLGFRAFGF